MRAFGNWCDSSTHSPHEQLIKKDCFVESDFYMNLKLNNIFELLPEDVDKEIFENLIESGSVKVERIISRGQASPPVGWYDQNQAEWVMILQGEAIICVEDDGDYHLVAGGYLNIPAHTRHRVKWTSPEIETIWLAIHYQG